MFRPGHELAAKDGYVLEHRLIVYEAGVQLRAGQDVHHKNGVRSDNRLQNLEVVDKGEHARRHAIARGSITNQFGTFRLRGARVVEVAG